MSLRTSRQRGEAIPEMSQHTPGLRLVAILLAMTKAVAISDPHTNGTQMGSGLEI